MEVGLKSKRMMVERGAPEGADWDGADDDAEEDEDGGAKRHSRAAFRAAAAKNWLGAGLASSAVETEPSGLI